MYWIGPALAIIGVIALLYGFAKNSRVVLAIAGVVLFLAGASSDFLRGVAQGHEDARSVQASRPTD